MKRTLIFILLSTLLFNLVSCKSASDFPDDEIAIKALCEKGKITRIHEIQGLGHRSPLENTTVQCITGIVTAVSGQGFYLQDLIEDDDDRSSEAIFVAHSTGAAP